MNEAVYQLLDGAAEDLGVSGVYLFGDAPADAEMPYLTYYASDSTLGRLAVDAVVIVRRVQIDAYAKHLADAESITDAAQGLLLGQTIETGNAALFLEPAGGRYRFSEAFSAKTDEERAYRSVLLLEQRETAAL